MRIVEVYKEIQEQEMNIVSNAKDLIFQFSRESFHFRSAMYRAHTRILFEFLATIKFFVKVLLLVRLPIGIDRGRKSTSLAANVSCCSYADLGTTQQFIYIDTDDCSDYLHICIN